MRVKIAGDIEVHVPDTIRRLTSYVLLEQEDWFEDEIKFLRRIISPGMRVVDVGANYGLYTLTLANRVAPTGMVWAFEPARATAAYLDRSIRANGFENIRLITAALSDHEGQASLGIYPDSEMNSLVVHANTEEFETVELSTLDVCAKELGWHDIDFLKLDAEGEEQRIIDGGVRFLEDNSPLVMFELKHGQQVNEGLIEKFNELGYSPCCLVPGLQLLRPMDSCEAHDSYLLNVFCCKSDRAAMLEQSGILARKPGARVNKECRSRMSWRSCIASKVYSKCLQSEWKRVIGRGTSGWKEYSAALSYYCLAHQYEIPAAQRYECLVQSAVFMDRALELETTVFRLQTSGRILWELGNRQGALQVLHKLLQLIGPETRLPASEPFLPASARFDNVALADKGQRVEWVLSGIIEQFEKLYVFSSFYVRGVGELQQALARVNYLCTHAFPTAEMARRLQLMRVLNGFQNAVEPAGIVGMSSEANRNAVLWSSGAVTV